MARFFPMQRNCPCSHGLPSRSTSGAISFLCARFSPLIEAGRVSVNRLMHADPAAPPTTVPDGISRRELLGAGAGLVAAGAMRRRAVAQDSLPTSPAADGSIDVPIVGRKMSLDDLRSVIAAEGSLLISSEYDVASTVIATRFQEYIDAVYGQQVTVTFAPVVPVNDALGFVYDVARSRSVAPYDVMATRKDH